jgi:hypothetical protein
MKKLFASERCARRQKPKRCLPSETPDFHGHLVSGYAERARPKISRQLYSEVRHRSLAAAMIAAFAIGAVMLFPLLH